MNKKVLRRLAFFVSVVILFSHSIFLKGISQDEINEGILINNNYSLEEQPFYQNLLNSSSRLEKDYSLTHLKGESPQETLLNFYAGMKDIDNKRIKLKEEAISIPGFFWSEKQKSEIENINQLFEESKLTLDSRAFPLSIRNYFTSIRAIQLKAILDYALGQNPDLFIIPVGSKTEDSELPSSWRIPNTSIRLSKMKKVGNEGYSYVFSENTVKQIPRIFEQIEKRAKIINTFSTPDFYEQHNSYPGDILPPTKIFFYLPDFLTSIYKTTRGISISLIVIILYLFLLRMLIFNVIKTYKKNSRMRHCDNDGQTWLVDKKDWLRVLLISPITPLTSIAKITILWISQLPEYFVFTIIYLSSILNFLALSILIFYLCESLSRDATAFILRMKNQSSLLYTQMVSNQVVPISRLISSIISIGLFYKLLIYLGLPSSVVLAISSVPGLAIGLGASKLITNFIAGLSIQTDKPLRVGDFCKVDATTGYIKRIGLRSMEIETLESRVTIPNSLVDDSTLVNYTKSYNGIQRQGLKLRLKVSSNFTSGQVNQLVKLVRSHLLSISIFVESVVSLDRNEGGITLVIYTLIESQDWETYTEIKEKLLIRIHQYMGQVYHSRRVIGVSYDTSVEQIKEIPFMFKSIILSDKELVFENAEFLKISEFSYDFIVTLVGKHKNYSDFLESIDNFNKLVIEKFNKENIKIPFPTTTFDQS